MHDPRKFYENSLAVHSSSLARVKRQIVQVSMARLVLFLVAAAAVYVLYGKTPWVWMVLITALVLFLFMVSRHTQLRYQKDKLLSLIAINEVELAVLDGKFHQLPDGQEFQVPGHYFSQDIDLFGRGSFFQYCNRTALRQGAAMLAGMLLENQIEGIRQKQEAIQELGVIPEWRQEFLATANLVKAETPTTQIVLWFANYRYFIPLSLKYLPYFFSFFSALVILSYSLGWITGWVLAGWFFLGLAITGMFAKRINRLSEDLAKLQSVFHQYKKLTGILEDTVFQSPLLKVRQGGIAQAGNKASKTLGRFSKLLNSLDQRNNMLIGFLGNGFLLRDIKVSFDIEAWIRKEGVMVAGWFETIEYFDAFNSLGNFAFNHPDYSYPEIVAESEVLKVTDAAHPLIRPERRVPNDLCIGEEEFFIITGANMAGKSTFLRTISLHIVMANTGLPVCATSSRYAPIKLITSMRTSDSLTDDESYFFSELKRLKFIVEEIAKDRYFIILDEILKGTNSTDKAIGSRKFVEKLVISKSTGIIATHDLSLCEVAVSQPRVKNYYFDAGIVEGELNFDYKLKPGICQNMNASFLLKKMGIVE